MKNGGDSLDADVWLLAKSRFWGIALMGRLAFSEVEIFVV